MDINQILFLIAVLNLLGDLYNLYRFRYHVPRWMMKVNLAALAICVGARILAPENSGSIAVAILLVYFVLIKLELKPSRRLSLPKFKSPATKVIIGLTLLAYGYQIYCHAIDDPYRLVQLGAVFSPLLEVGELWRLISAQFLHWGAAHLLMNMLGLWFLGPRVESMITGSGNSGRKSPILGPLRFTLTYLVCGIGGMATAWGLSYLNSGAKPFVVLGASASVLGLVGIQAAWALRAVRQSGSVVAKAQLSAMTQILVLQTIFDWLVPQVSSTAHIGGAVVGFLIGTTFVKPRT